MPDIFENRLSRLRAKMKQNNIDGVMITERVNYMYMSGFTGTSAILFIDENRAALLTDFRYVEQAASQAPDYEIIQYRGGQYDELNRLIEEDGIRSLSFEDSRVTYAEYSEYHEKLKAAEFLPLGRVLEELRIVKDESEIDVIRRAVKIADNVFSHILEYIKPGVSEIELAAEMEHEMRREGAIGPSFDTIIASGLRASMPHGVASEKKIEAGDIITLDFGALYKGYCSDMTRTVFLGKPDPELARIYKIVLEANRLGLDTVRSGMTGREVDAVVRKFISDAGFGDNFGHGLGHGVGLEIHEDPTLSMRGDLVLKEGMIVTVEPGIYVTGLGGVRIEDMVAIGADNVSILTASTKEVIVL